MKKTRTICQLDVETDGRTKTKVWREAPSVHLSLFYGQSRVLEG
jgi:hypothetical protein